MFTESLQISAVFLPDVFGLYWISGSVCMCALTLAAFAHVLIEKHLQVLVVVCADVCTRAFGVCVQSCSVCGEGAGRPRLAGAVEVAHNAHMCHIGFVAPSQPGLRVCGNSWLPFGVRVCARHRG